MTEPSPPGPHRPSAGLSPTRTPGRGGGDSGSFLSDSGSGLKDTKDDKDSKDGAEKDGNKAGRRTLPSPGGPVGGRERGRG